MKQTHLTLAYFHPEAKNNTISAPTLWTNAEISIAVVAACLPPLGPLLYTLKPKLWYQSLRQKFSSRYSSGSNIAMKDLQESSSLEG